jgi:NAD(P)-dependent dehydrogenase (short-subunit alcohol dehydrogenase family)
VAAPALHVGGWFDLFLGTVHVVCNNAGVGPLAAIADLTMTDWHWIIGVNLYGVIHGVQAFLPIRVPPGNATACQAMTRPRRAAPRSRVRFPVIVMLRLIPGFMAVTRAKARSVKSENLIIPNGRWCYGAAIGSTPSVACWFRRVHRLLTCGIGARRPV